MKLFGSEGFCESYRFLNWNNLNLVVCEVHDVKGNMSMLAMVNVNIEQKDFQVLLAPSGKNTGGGGDWPGPRLRPEA